MNQKQEKEFLKKGIAAFSYGFEALIIPPCNPRPAVNTRLVISVTMLMFKGFCFRIGQKARNVMRSDNNKRKMENESK
jgi:hypothetical protein